MRRSRGNHRVPLDGRELAQRCAAATCRFRGCSVRAGAHLLSLAAPACSGRRSAGIAPAKPSAFAPPHPRATSAALGLRPPRDLRSRLASLISELASHEVPGFGAAALPSALGHEVLASALANCEGPRRLRIRPAVANLPPPPRHPCWRTKCRDAAISTRTKALEGLESCRRGGAS